MKNFKLKILILFSIIIGIFPAYKLIAAVTASKKATTAAASSTGKTAPSVKADTAKAGEKDGAAAVEDVKKETKGNVIISSVLKIIEKVTSKLETEINLGQIAAAIIPSQGGEKSDIEKYLEKIVIKTPVVKSLKTGVRVVGTIIVNKNPLTASIEISKGEDGWVCVCYITSAKKWLLTQYFPDLLTLKKIFSGVDDKLLQPDLFEFEESYFYISTTDIAEHSELGSVVSGVGFKGKLRFIGFFDIFDKIFALQGKPVEIAGAIKVPKIIGSEFSIKIPTSAVILPETLKVGGRDVKLIPGFSVRLGTHELSIKITEDIPVIKANGRIAVRLPAQFTKEELVFFSGIDFSGTRLKLYGGQEKTLKNVFGVNDLDLSGCKIGLTWDFVASAQLAAELGAVTAGLGTLVGLLPMGVIIEGGIKSGKSNLDLKADVSIHGTKAVDLTYYSKGSLFTKDFAKFWLDVLVKNQDPKVAADFIAQVPAFTFEDVVIDAAWSTETEKKFNLSVGKVELIPGQTAKMDLSVSEKGISGSGQMSPVSLPSKNNPLLEITSKTDKKVGPSFSIDCKISPLKLALTSDARIFADLGPVLGKLDTATIIDVSDQGLVLDSQTRLLDCDSTLKITGKLDGKIDSWGASGTFDQKSTTKLTGLLQEASKELLKASADVKKQRDDAIKNIDFAKEKARKDIEYEKNKAVNDINSYFNNEINKANNSINILKRDRDRWVNICESKKHWLDLLRLERAACRIANVDWRSLAYLGAIFYRDVILKGTAGVAKLATQTVMSVGQIFADIGTNVAKDFTALGTNIAADFTKILSDIAKLVEEITTKAFKLNSLKFNATVDDLKKLKLPMIEYDAIVLGMPRHNKLQLDIKNPKVFIEALAKELLSPMQADISKKVISVEGRAKIRLAEEDKKAAAGLNKAKADALKAKK